MATLRLVVTLRSAADPHPPLEVANRFESLVDRRATIPTPMALRSGTRLGPYEIVELRGKGGMGEVYAGRDTRLGCTIAFKVVLMSKLGQ